VNGKLHGSTALADCDRHGRVLEERRTPGWAVTDNTESNARNDRVRATEEDLISKILEGDRDLFLELIRPYERTVYATLITMLRSKEDAEDVTQDVLLKALARLQQFRRESAFGTWLIQIAINEARMRKRKMRHGTMFSLTSAADDEGAYVPKDFADWREIPSEALERSETREALAKALALLEEHYRLAFILRDVNELSITETANVLGITRGAVKTRLRRARLMLRDILSPGLQQGGEVGLAFKEARNPWE
jgi:RNA polymerase sigma-70 factor (ECF subfamily)